MNKPPEFADWNDVLGQASAEDPRRVWLRFPGDGPDEELTFGDVNALADHHAHVLSAAGVRRGDRVCILLPNGSPWVGALFGAWRLGAVAVPLAPPFRSGPEAMDQLRVGLHAVRDCKAQAIMTSAEFRDLLLDSGEVPPAIIAVKEGVDAASASPASLPPPGPLADEVAIIQYTSGPALTPRGVELTHRGLIAAADATGRALGAGPRDEGVSWAPFFQDMGLVGVLLLSLRWRYPVTAMIPERFLLRPHEWIQVMSARRATISVAPNFAWRLCARRLQDRHLEGLDLSAWRVALTGAEMNEPDTLAAFCARLEPTGFRPGAMVAAYGLAENGIAATVTRPGAPPAVRPVPGSPDRRVVSCGGPVHGQEIQIRHKGAPAGERVIGEVWIRGPSLMRGYHGRPAETAAVLQDGWLDTGDLGFMEDGELFITGRRKDLIIRRGRNVYPSDVERIVAELPGVVRAVAFSERSVEEGTDSLTVVAGCDGSIEDTRQLEKTIGRQLMRVLGIQPGRVATAPAAQLDMGDPSRARAAWQARLTGGGAV
ncbi:MAG: 4-hydroxyphenylalkanoate adenylyltransferase [Myxococcota bacterium]|nr:4-hydroxyphenylalkanoate adenylyltransferase [Myxococcota bacterium]